MPQKLSVTSDVEARVKTELKAERLQSEAKLEKRQPKILGQLTEAGYYK